MRTIIKLIDDFCECWYYIHVLLVMFQNIKHNQHIFIHDDKVFYIFNYRYSGLSGNIRSLQLGPPDGDSSGVYDLRLPRPFWE